MEMGSKWVKISISSGLGELEIYSEGKEEGRGERLIGESGFMMRNGYDRGSEKLGNEVVRVVKKWVRRGSGGRGSDWDGEWGNRIKG